WTGFILPLVLAAVVFPAAAGAKEGPPGPDGLPQALPGHPWTFFIGAPRVDTLSFAPAEIMLAARRRLDLDQWRIFTFDPGKAEIATMWKPLHHPLLLLFMGKVRARCAVKLQSLGAGRTRMIFQAALASHHKLEGNPMLGTAMRAYAKAARNFQAEVRSDLNGRRRLSSIKP
ncbi:MAG TPA: hypothetical protein VK527_11315, partial [Candidatus Limnocylindrales bacterium]|nr:hypothetical protein [Candidatus Limnocylindrales bacterium]